MRVSARARARARVRVRVRVRAKAPILGFIGFLGFGTMGRELRVTNMPAVNAPMATLICVTTKYNVLPYTRFTGRPRISCTRSW